MSLQGLKSLDFKTFKTPIFSLSSPSLESLDFKTFKILENLDFKTFKIIFQFFEKKTNFATSDFCPICIGKLWDCQDFKGEKIGASTPL